MRDGLRGLLDIGLSRGPAQPIFHWRASHRLVVLAYHGVDDADRFAQHLDYVCRRMHPVSLHQVTRAARGEGGLPTRACLITFDDGHRSVFERAFPMLRARGIPAVAFVVAGLIDTERPFWWIEVRDLVEAGGKVPGWPPLHAAQLARRLKAVSDERRLAVIAELRRTARRVPRPTPQLKAEELRAMDADGVTIGSHSLTHACLARCTEERLREEVEGAHRSLSSILGHEPSSFAYPDGGRNPRVTSAVATAGYEAAFLFDHRTSLPRPPHPLAISRVRVDSHTGTDRFRTIVSGLHPAVHHAFGRT